MQVTLPFPYTNTNVHFCLQQEEALSFFEAIGLFSSQVVLLADKTTAELFAPKIKALLETKVKKISILIIPSGEEGKSRKVKEQIEDFLMQTGAGKDTCLLCLGGGSLLDVGGFVASTYARGIPLAFIPTTLLAMCDACLGGKTGINTPYGKNLIGSFYPAKEILICTDFLSYLPEQELQNALAEIIKYGLISTPPIFVLLKENQCLWEKKDPAFLLNLIKLSLFAKQQIIEQDPQEKGLRHILNFGHTIGHAVEGFSKYTYSHGQAVAIGLYVETRLSKEESLLSEEDYNQIIALLQDYGFPQKKEVFYYQDLIHFLALDKKNKGGKSRFVLLSSLGKAASFDGAYCTSLPEESIQKALSWYQESLSSSCCL